MIIMYLCDPFKNGNCTKISCFFCKCSIDKWCLHTDKIEYSKNYIQVPTNDQLNKNFDKKGDFYFEVNK